MGELTYLRTQHTQLYSVEKTLIKWDATHYHHALLPVLVIPKPKRKLQLCSPQCAFAMIKPPMTQGLGEGKVKLLTMNPVVAGSPLLAGDYFEYTTQN